VEDLVDGESEMEFSCPSIDVSGIAPSTLANAGLLMAGLFVDGNEVATVNMVVMVTKDADGRLFRQILSPLE
jgi:hypothetical protein